MAETLEYKNMSEEHSLWHPMLHEIMNYINLHSELFDSDYLMQLKECNTLGRIFELVVCRHLKSCGLVYKPKEFDFILHSNGLDINVEVTTKIVNFNDVTVKTQCAITRQNAEMIYLLEQINRAINKKYKDFKRKKKLVGEQPFLLFITLKANCLRIPDHFRDFSLSHIKNMLVNMHEISGVVIAWDWPYWFPEMAEKCFGAVIKKPNDFCFIHNSKAKHQIPKNMNLKCEFIL